MDCSAVLLLGWNIVMNIVETNVVVVAVPGGGSGRTEDVQPGEAETLAERCSGEGSR